MKTVAALIVLFAVSIAAAETLVTKTGKKYRDYEVGGINAKGVNIIYRDGSVNIPLDEWPDDKKSEIAEQLAEYRRSQKAAANPKPPAPAPVLPGTAPAPIPAPAVRQPAVPAPAPAPVVRRPGVTPPPPVTRKAEVTPAPVPAPPPAQASQFSREEINKRYNFSSIDQRLLLDNADSFLGVRPGTHIADVPNVLFDQVSSWIGEAESTGTLYFPWVPSPEYALPAPPGKAWEYKLHVMDTGQVASVGARMFKLDPDDFIPICKTAQFIENKYGRKFVDGHDGEVREHGGKDKNGQKTVTMRSEPTRFGSEGLSGIARQWNQYKNKNFDLRAKLGQIRFICYKNTDGVVAFFIGESSLSSQLLFQSMIRTYKVVPRPGTTGTVPKPKVEEDDDDDDEKPAAKSGKHLGPLPDLNILPVDMRNKLRRIIIPLASFEGMYLPVTVEYISDELKRLDPEKRGVPIMLDKKDRKRGEEIQLDIAFWEKTSGLDMIRAVCREANANWRVENGTLVIFLSPQGARPATVPDAPPPETETSIPDDAPSVWERIPRSTRLDPNTLPPHLQKKLRTITVSMSHIEGGGLQAILKHISDELKMNDPEGRGVDIVLASKDLKRGEEISKRGMGFREMSGLDALMSACLVAKANWYVKGEKVVVFFPSKQDPDPAVLPPQIREKLRGVELGWLDYDNMELMVVINYIVRLVNRLDPAGEGVQIEFAAKDVSRATTEDARVDMKLGRQNALDGLAAICNVIGANWRVENGKIILFYQK